MDGSDVTPPDVTYVEDQNIGWSDGIKGNRIWSSEFKNGGLDEESSWLVDTLKKRTNS